MVQGFYTLDEAARVLGMAPEELNRMAQRREVRAFADRGTWRFRTQDIEELAKKRGSTRRSVAHSAAPSPPPLPADDDAPIPLAGDDNVEVGQEFFPSSGPASKGGSGPLSRSPLTVGESDVRLDIAGEDFNLVLTEDDELKRPSSQLGPVSSKSMAKRPSQIGGAETTASGRLVPKRRTAMYHSARQDSEVQLPPPAPSDNDSDVRLDFDTGLAALENSGVNIGEQLPPVTGGSSARLESGRRSKLGPGDPNAMLTEEIDLDAEVGRADVPRAPTSKIKPKTKARSALRPPELPTTSPFELSEADLQLEPMPEEKTGSEFELGFGSQDTGAVTAESSDEDVSLGDLPPRSDLASRAGMSGINLQAPADSGISLERSGPTTEEIEFGLQADDASPRTGDAREFSPSSEFELTLDEEPSGSLDQSQDTAGSKDIFETDFDLPALEEESASQVVALDETDSSVASSDFELAVEDESGSQVVEESVSEVVPLDDESLSASQDSEPLVAVDQALTSEVLSQSGEEEEEEEKVGAAAAPAEWGVLPVAMLIPCVLVMIVVGIMSYELLHGMWGYRQPTKVASPVISGLSNLFSDEVENK
ncbi:MAG: helix-turn-helix domain-containing protein [Gemmataceae bacterium]|nr:helix-turn-helix domain-containing protein [Gemmataceae bacterium]MDW8264230.1 helix-turn-helix domain-containing protein [Gemmataceae bacterium]